MTLLDDAQTESAATDERTTDEHPSDEQPSADQTTDEQPSAERTADERAAEHHGPIRTPDGTVIDPSGRITFRGMRIRRVRLKSVAKISFIFWLLAFGVLIGTVVAVWNVALAFGYVDSFEETMITSLGLEAFEIDGGGVFGVIAGAIAVLCLLGWLGTLAMAAVYNAACGVLGGLAVETGPLQRRRRVFSWRHRGFVTVSE